MLVDLLIFSALVAIGFNAASLATGRFFSVTLLLACGIAFLVGGAIAFSSGIFSTRAKEKIMHRNEQWSVENLRQGERRAHPYLLLAVLLFLESLLLSLFSL